jgi:hypothetical protein
MYASRMKNGVMIDSQFSLSRHDQAIALAGDIASA